MGPILKGRAILEWLVLEDGKPEILECYVYWRHGKNIFLVILYKKV